MLIEEGTPLVAAMGHCKRYIRKLAELSLDAILGPQKLSSLT